MMRSILLVGLAISIATLCNAQSDSLKYPVISYRQKQAKSYKITKGIAWTLLAGGVIAASIGAVRNAEEGWGTGLNGIVGGSAATVVSIPFFVISHNKKKKLKQLSGN